MLYITALVIILDNVFVLRSVLYISALEIILENIVCVLRGVLHISALEIILENIVSVCTEKCSLYFTFRDNPGEH